MTTIASTTTTTSVNAELTCREFAREFPSANVRRAIQLAEAGTLTWAQVEGIFASALRGGLKKVGA
jgi:hypothetical protein